jgi:hypothetical protein
MSTREPCDARPRSSKRRILSTSSWDVSNVAAPVSLAVRLEPFCTRQFSAVDSQRSTISIVHTVCRPSGPRVLGNWLDPCIAGIEKGGVESFGRDVISVGRAENSLSASSDEVIAVGRPVCWRCNKAMIRLNIRSLIRRNKAELCWIRRALTALEGGERLSADRHQTPIQKKKRESYHHEGLQSVVLGRLSKGSASRR